MPKSKNRGHRESRRPQRELPVVPVLGNLSMPRRGNRAAAKYVATIGPLWDRRRADRKARKNAQRRRDAALANPRRKHLDKGVRLRLLGLMPNWSFDHRIKAFVMKGSPPAPVEEFLDAVVAVRPEPLVLRVSGLSQQEAARMRGYLTAGSVLIVVNHRFDHDRAPAVLALV